MTKLKEMLINLHDFVDEIRDEGYDELANDMSCYIDEIIKEYDSSNPIKQIEQWQKDRLLDKQEYIPINEATNIIEELLEGMGYKVPKEYRNDLKEEVRNSIFTLTEELELKYIEPKEEDIIDSILDQIVFSIGSIMKLGYDPEYALNKCIKHINSRTGKIVDGKFQKDLDVKTYEPEYNKCKRSK